MPSMWWVAGAIAVAVLLSAYLIWTASRVERLHMRAAAAARALDAHLDAGPEEREAAENDLTRQLRATEPDDEVLAANRRLAVARQVHTDLVRDALSARRRRLVRLLRMSRRYPEPGYFDIDDPILLAVPAPARAAPPLAAEQAT
jgi:hypothetical protein